MIVMQKAIVFDNDIAFSFRHFIFATGIVLNILSCLVGTCFL